MSAGARSPRPHTGHPPARPGFARASSAATGTASTGPGLLPVVMYTVTGAWSRVPAADGWVSVTVTGIVALLAVPDATRAD